jgi:2-polyprenyl-3-methyl-5-hydroxy-6-metoxy-1,4-benzoquinol methylase
MRYEVNRDHCLSYDKYKKFYDNQSKDPVLRKIRKDDRMKPINWAVKQTLNSKEPPCNILDVGCMNGNIELALATLWYNVTAIDITENFIEGSKQNTVVVNQYIRYAVLPVEKINELNGKYQVIICLSVLEHVVSFDKAFSSMLDVADDRALMLFTVPLYKSWFTEEHTRIFTDENIYDYFPKNSEISKIKFSDDPNKLGWFTIKYIKG